MTATPTLVSALRQPTQAATAQLLQVSAAYVSQLETAVADARRGRRPSGRLVARMVARAGLDGEETLALLRRLWPDEFDA